MKKINVSGGVIFQKGDNGEYKILMIQRSSDDHFPDHWEFPRGKCDNGKNEPLVKCLKREVKEESGLDVIPIKYIDKFTYSADKGTRLSTQYNFLCKLKDPKQKVKLSFEHQDYKYITTPGEAELLALPEIKKILKKAFELLDENKVISPDPKFPLSDSDIIKEYLDFLHSKE